MDKQKICIILPCFLPVPAVCGGAIETLVDSLAYYNNKLNLLELTIVSIFNPIAYKISLNYPSVKWIFIKNIFLVRFTDYLFRIIRKLTHKSYPISFYDYAVFKKIKKLKFDKIVFESGNIFFVKKYLEVFPKEKIYYHFHSIDRSTPEIKDYIGEVISISNYLKKEFIKTSNFDFDKVHVLLNGIKLDKFSKKLDDMEISNLKSKLHINGEFVCLYIGRLIKDKGIFELVEAMSKINDKNIKLLIIGEGTGFNINFIHELNVKIKNNKNIIKIGFIPNNQLYRYFSIADCLIMPSVCEEGAGLVQIEAYAAGLPTIVSNRGGILEYSISNWHIVVDYNENFIDNLAMAIVKMKTEINNYKIIDTEILNKGLIDFSDESYYYNFVKIMLGKR